MTAAWAIFIFAVIVIILLLALYISGWVKRLPAWTGFRFEKDDNKVLITEEKRPDQTTQYVETREILPGRTLWDWLQLLIIPVILAIVAFAFNAGQASTNQEIEHQNMQEQVVDGYLDRMANLLLMYKLCDSKLNDPVRATAQAITLTALDRLDGGHKSIVMLFLYRADLIQYHWIYQDQKSVPPDKVPPCPGSSLEQKTDKVQPIITLPWGHLEGIDIEDIDLKNIDLHNTYLSGVNLHGSSLYRANLGDTVADSIDLSNAYMVSANLYHVYFQNANFQDAVLREANMPGALLSYAQLSRADMRGVNLKVYIREDGLKIPAQLDHAALDHARLNDAILVGANLSNADLTGADLSSADLTDANLSNAIVTQKQLAQAKSLAGAIMPDGTKHT